MLGGPSMSIGPSVIVEFQLSHGSLGAGQLVLLRFLCPEIAEPVRADVGLQVPFQSGLDFWHHVAVDDDEDALEETGRFNGKNDFNPVDGMGVFWGLHQPGSR